MKIVSSAPGKLILMGEHAVVYGYPCIVTAVDKRLYVEVEKVSAGEDKFITPQVKGHRFLKETVVFFKEKYKIKDSLKILTRGDFSHKVGLGSSSAVIVATFNALANLFKITLTKKELFEISHEVNLKIQKVGSGFDIAATSYGGTQYFIKGGKVIQPLNLQRLPLVIGYSGLKADTPTLIKQVNKQYQENKKKTVLIFNQIKILVDQGKDELVKSNFEKFGVLMTKNHMLLKDLKVSSLKLDKMVEVALEAGAWGAKLSGAGGGDCMVALTPENRIKEVERAIVKIGGEIIRANVNSQGVRIEI